MSFPRFDHAVRINAADIDFMGHVNNATYLTWIQEAVLAHWRLIASPAAVAAHVWVAISHEITYRKPAFLHDEVTASVTLEQVRRESAFYETVVRRGTERLAQARSRWCCLDARSLRPVRIAAEITQVLTATGIRDEGFEREPVAA